MNEWEEALATGKVLPPKTKKDTQKEKKVRVSPNQLLAIRREDEAR